ncbi:Na+/H+ antiporter family protein [Desulfuribacillus alkaliarsenatis]|uniref:Sodium:proton antiporter n=1 Tax=Desulfuribacillus alkaliarsenatis TaxID=766136 RepID=A0A1E5G1A4_9FIRM|nr:Na+/H+ antiporter NhaC family protein [Desulfuribacillus alkaliarsenatis]OEF96687.1 sodium:proton antiporter [Desulfuribacillus alkaliarsenatis]
MLFNPVVISVIVVVVLSLARVNVLLALIAGALVAGLVAGLPLGETIPMLVSGMDGQLNTALSYILLGMFAVLIAKSKITNVLVQILIKALQGKRGFLLLAIAAVASLSQNVVPVHIAFIPILIPPLLALFNRMQVDRRAVATALTFGLKAPYILLPAGYGLIFHGIIQREMEAHGATIGISEIPLALLIPVSGMVVGLFIAIFFTYRKSRDYKPLEESSLLDAVTPDEKVSWNKGHTFTVIAIVAALFVQVQFSSMVLGALIGIAIMLVFNVVSWRKTDDVVNKGIAMMGMIAFVMLVASGYATILRETGAVAELVEVSSGILSGSQIIAAFIMLLIGLTITMGIGTSFGTIPIIAALYVPLGLELGFSVMAIAALIGTAAALGDAGSPASDSTLGPTAGLNADGQHNHIWDTCVPTFIHFNIPLIIFGVIAAIIF